MGSVPDPRGLLIVPCRLFPSWRKESCNVKYWDPSVVTVQLPVRSLLLEPEVPDESREDDRSGGGASFIGPSEPVFFVALAVLAGGGGSMVTSSGFSNLNNNSVSERIWICSPLL